MTVFQPVKENLTNLNHLSGYDLTTLLLRGGLSKLELNPNTKLVLLYLSTCYNEQKGVVYPKVSTIAQSLDISERGVIRALQELTEKACILRTKRGSNKNSYVITQKVLLSNDTSDNKKCHDVTSSSDTVSPPCIEVKQHEVKEQQQVKEPEKPTKKVVAFLPKSKSITLEDVPEIIKQNKKVQNPCAYWASLSEEVKKQYLQKQREKDENARKKLEIQKAEAEKRQKEREELERAKNEPPFWTVCTRAKAVEHLQKFSSPALRKLLRTGYRAELMNKFDIGMGELEGVMSA